ncbi:MAG: enoyl-CoA hydratase/isomerase family protein [Actinomycetia bacterium]|nr:enoyl-CoA hydratase/isomerase family protein [Actinomycetes bacterium]
MIRSETDGHVTTLTLDAPGVKNAFDEAMIRGLVDGIQAANANPGCRCLIITGANHTFCTGRNLSGPQSNEIGDVLDREGLWEQVFQALHHSTTPSVSVVEGYAVAGGFTLAMGCDFVVAEEEAIFGAFEMRNGFPAAVNTPLLAKLVPPRLALEWGMLGQPIPATRLHAHGLINRLGSGSDGLAEVAGQFVADLVALEPEAVAMTMEIHRAARNLPLADALTMGKQQNTLIAASGMLERAMHRFAARRQAG